MIPASQLGLSLSQNKVGKQRKKYLKGLAKQSMEERGLVLQGAHELSKAKETNFEDLGDTPGEWEELLPT